MEKAPESKEMTIEAEVDRIFGLQHEAQNLHRVKMSTAKERIARIKKMERYLQSEPNLSEWTDALWKDLHKCREEAIATEWVTVLTNLKLIYAELRGWMADEAINTPLALTGLKSWVRREAKGHVLIIAPWNYPLQLVLNPLIYAIAAGNAVLIKPSEMAPATAAFLKKMVADVFDEREVAVVEGGVQTATALLKKPFHHIFFTGSPNVGKIVMRAAAENLTSVTLELGGKSPVILDGSFDVATAAERIAWGKCVNAGQTCIAPDYALVPENELDAFTDAFARSVDRFYNPKGKGLEHSKDYGRIIDNRNYERMVNLIEDAMQKGANLVLEGKHHVDDLLVTPHVLTNVSGDMKVMQEEIFGPVLPVLTYRHQKEIPEIINQFERPLALYIMSKNQKNIDFILQYTTSGGVGINETLVTVINPELPFGGVNHSGIGKSNGKYSFLEFTNERGVVKRTWFNFKMIYPPYNSAIIKWLMKAAKW